MSVDTADYLYCAISDLQRGIGIAIGYLTGLKKLLADNKFSEAEETESVLSAIVACANTAGTLVAKTVEPGDNS